MPTFNHLLIMIELPASDSMPSLRLLTDANCPARTRPTGTKNTSHLEVFGVTAETVREQLVNIARPYPRGPLRGT